MTQHDFGFLGPIGPEAHGSRPCYLAGCRCLPCCSAQPTLGPLTVDAGRARRHLLALQGKGVGYRRAARLAGIGARTVKQIRTGERGRITQEVEAAILSIKGINASLAHGAYVNAYEARRKLRTLLQEGFTIERLAAVLHLRPETIERDTMVIPDELHDIHVPRTRVSTVLRVRAFFARVMAEGPELPRAEN